MRALRLSAVTGIVIFMAGLLDCGLDSQGLLRAADGGEDGAQRSGDDAAVSGSDDADGVGNPAPSEEAGTSNDAAAAIPPTPLDASTPVQTDSAPTEDVAVDGPFTCSGCAATKCPTQLAACGKGSQCLAYRDCAEGCSGASSSSCSTTCESMYPAGESAFGALTICDLGCGVGCTASLTIGTP
jgi:hypothetical protein